MDMADGEENLPAKLWLVVQQIGEKLTHSERLLSNVHEYPQDFVVLVPLPVVVEVLVLSYRRVDLRTAVVG